MLAGQIFCTEIDDYMPLLVFSCSAVSCMLLKDFSFV